MGNNEVSLSYCLMFTLHFLSSILHPATVKGIGVEVTLYKGDCVLSLTMLGVQKMQNNHTVTLTLIILKTMVKNLCPIRGAHVFAECNRSRLDLLKKGLSKLQSNV
jgi:hypothetical protein